MATAESIQQAPIGDSDLDDVLDGASWDPDADTGAPDNRPAPRKRRFLSSIQGKIVSRTLAIALIPLLLVGSVTLFSLWRLRNAATEGLAAAETTLDNDVTGSNLTAHAKSVGSEIETLMVERITDIIILSSAADTVAAALAGAELASDLGIDTDSTEANEARFADTRTIDASPGTSQRLEERIAIQPEFGELFLTDRNGFTTAGSGPTTDFVQSDEFWWQEAWSEGLHVSSAAFDESAGIASLDIAARIDDPSNDQPIGVIKASLDLAEIQAVADRHRILDASQNNLNVTVFTTDGLILAETVTGHSPGRIMEPTATFQNDRLAAATAALDATESGAFLGEESSAGFELTRSTLAALGGMDLVHPPSFVIMVDQSTAKAKAPLDSFASLSSDLDDTIRSALALLGIIIAAVFIGAIAAPGFIVRRIVQPLVQLRGEAEAVADERLPAVMDQLESTEEIGSVELLEPIAIGDDDEISDLSIAFTSVQDTAVRLATEQARSRRNISRLFIDLGRRNQNLIGRQLEFIDTLEQSERDPDALENLFKLDHLATRMRRNAESLLVLAGEDQPRRWSRPLPIGDVIRAAISEVEDYNRVELTSINETRVIGSAASDIAHLLAELIENATMFSPPSSPVMILGRRSSAGYTISIVDHGIGLSRVDMAALNDNLVAANTIDQTGGSSLGLYVVGRLAARHGIGVRLLESPAEGVTAKVMLPNAVLDDDVELTHEPTWRVEPAVERRAALELGLPPESEETDGTPSRTPVLTSGLVDIDESLAAQPIEARVISRDDRGADPTAADATAGADDGDIIDLRDRDEHTPTAHATAPEDVDAARTDADPKPADSNGHAGNGHAGNGHVGNGRASNGQASNGKASNGTARRTTSANGTTPTPPLGGATSPPQTRNGTSATVGNGARNGNGARHGDGTDRPRTNGSGNGRSNEQAEFTPSGFRRRTSKAATKASEPAKPASKPARDADDVRRKLDRFRAGVESGRAATSTTDDSKPGDSRDGGSA